MSTFDLSGVPPERQNDVEEALYDLMRNKVHLWQLLEDLALFMNVPIATIVYNIASKQEATLTEEKISQLRKRAQENEHREINTLLGDINIDL